VPDPAAALLADLSWPEVDHRVRGGAVLAVPLGSTEQHGPHLPLSTDTDIAVALCNRLAAVRADVLVAPPVPYGSSGEHAGFAGTLSIGQAALELLIVELVRSATETFASVVLVCGHGGNASALGRAVQTLRGESRDVLAFMPRWEGDPHAGRPETSMMLALRPEVVAMDRAIPGDTRPITVILPALRTGGVRAVSESGVLGDPTGADVAEGHALLEAISRTLIDEVNAWRETPRR
jgi:mycofactocin system creatininase family protein